LNAFGIIGIRKIETGHCLFKKSFLLSIPEHKNIVRNLSLLFASKARQLVTRFLLARQFFFTYFDDFIINGDYQKRIFIFSIKPAHRHKFPFCVSALLLEQIYFR